MCDGSVTGGSIVCCATALAPVIVKILEQALVSTISSEYLNALLVLLCEKMRAHTHTHTPLWIFVFGFWILFGYDKEVQLLLGLSIFVFDYFLRFCSVFDVSWISCTFEYLFIVMCLCWLLCLLPSGLPRLWLCTEMFLKTICGCNLGTKIILSFSRVYFG